MREITVRLGGSEYVIRQLPMRAESAWRNQLRLAIAPAVDALGRLDMTIETVDDLAGLVRSLSPMLLGAPETVLELLRAYAPGLAWETIEETAYSDEIVTALLEVVKLAYPFGAALGLAKLASGAATTSATTSMS